MSNNILTAEEFLQNHHQISHFYNDETDKMCCFSDDMQKAMIEFAKLHVKAALKEALESIPCLGSSTDIATYEEVEKAVLNAYPEDLIK